MPDSINATIQILHPGDVALALQGERLVTLLGSCIAVILTDPRRTVGAMCHIVHSGHPSPANRGNTAYAVCAMEQMFARLRGVGITPQLCHAIVFGGGNMFPGLFSSKHVGASNIEWIDAFLQGHGIDVVGASTGGNCYRKIDWTVGLDPICIECDGGTVDHEQHKGF